MMLYLGIGFIVIIIIVGICFSDQFELLDVDKRELQSIVVGLILIIILGAYFIIYPYFKPVTSHDIVQTNNEVHTTPSPGVPYEFAKNFVRDRLVSPKTSEFMPLSQAHCVLLPDQKTWKITSFVDSQNNFGAMVRIKWYVKIMDTGDTWKLLDIKFGDEI